MILVWVMPGLPLPISTTSELKTVNPVVITPINNVTGTIVEATDRIAVKSAEWTLITFFDLSQLAQEIETVKKGIQSIKQWCSTAYEVCPTIIQTLQQEVAEIQDADQLMHHQRQKRGALNIVGNIANGLFGVLDDQYARRMEEIISKLRAQEGVTHKIVENQTSILDTTINIMRRTTIETQKRMPDLEASLARIKIRSHAADRYLPHAVSELVVVANHIRRVQDAVLNVLIGAHEGKLSPALVSVEQVKQVITKIQTHLPPGRRLPITSETARDLYRLATTRVQETEDLLMFHTSVPLVEEDEFTVYRMEPIPQITREGLVITKTETGYLAIDDHRKHHFAINQEHLRQCISMTNGIKVCDFKQTLFGPDAHQLPCTMAALAKHQAGECKPEPIKGTSYWVQLTEQNAWIFGTTKPITMTYVCSAEKDQVIIEGVGKMTIRQDCVIQSPTITLLGRAQVNSSGTVKMSGGYVHEWPSQEKIKTTEGQLESTLDQLDRLHAEVQGLKTWTKQAQEDVDSETDWNLAHQYSGVIMLGIAILVAAWAGYTRCVWKDTSATNQRTIPAQGEGFQLIEQHLAAVTRDGHHRRFEVYDPGTSQ
ncbi:uncharacterized protein LOC123258208 [Drosophila ananassae]|uniref:uncharacterized protein LOC123258208 n=1 Tax=Drosophila ananassae TaxID=7217 RepID=UPI001CFF75F7|nr:uncharacterized protein LOC123258208 [Drosophila ananassae]